MRLLIVDDDRELGAELAELLRAEGHEVDQTADSGHGAHLIQTQTYACCLLDYKMPGFDGCQLLKRLKARHPLGAVIVMSGRPRIDALLRDEQVDGLVAGVLHKPFSIEALLDLLRPLA